MEQVAFLVHLEEAELPSDVPSALLARARKVVHEPSPLPRFEWRWAGVAAATAVIVGLVSLTILQIGRDDTAPDQRVRSPQQEAVSPKILSPLEGARLPGHQTEFRWEPVPGALFYRVRLLTGEGDRVWEARTEGTSLRLPREIRLTEGAKYFVTVWAQLSDGRRLRSPAVGFEIGG
jgi:hypothetical protein